jgi:hypothetical protein
MPDGALDPMQSRLEVPAAEDSLMTPEEIFSLVHHDIALVEEEFDRSVSDVSTLVSSIARYLHDGGGRRLYCLHRDWSAVKRPLRRFEWVRLWKCSIPPLWSTTT